MRESAQHNIVGQEVCVAHSRDRINAKRVAPNGVLPYIRLRRGHNNLAIEGHFFALLSEMIVAIHILQSVNAILSSSHATNNKVSTRIGFGHSHHW